MSHRPATYYYVEKSARRKASCWAPNGRGFPSLEDLHAAGPLARVVSFL